MEDQVLLLHGFNKTSRDMATLSAHLEERGFHCRSLNLPLTRLEFDRSASRVEQALLEMTAGNNRKIHLVGHSTGGLLIRQVLKETSVADLIGRCVQIAAPNQGSSLAYTASKVKGYTYYFKTLRSLHTDYIEKLNLPEAQAVSIGAIAGTRSHLWLGKLLKGANDGRVELASVHYPGLADFIELPYGHKEIHHQQETAELIVRFLRSGHF